VHRRRTGSAGIVAGSTGGAAAGPDRNRLVSGAAGAGAAAVAVTVDVAAAGRAQLGVGRG
jgi:hypothetical protein